MRTEAYGIKNNSKVGYRCEVVEEYDNNTGFMAMEKWTGWHASIMMQHIAEGKITSGAFPIEKALTGKEFYKQAKKRNYNINIKKLKTD